MVAVQRNKAAHVARTKGSLVHTYPQVLSITLLGIFAQTLPVPDPPRPTAGPD